ncbi:iron-containing alcohol dehydrogenase, partial [Gammaproteobacteria bacterium]|nr:iron-containing alcohol dehydrogenase [Gammaproteobacteria bacterium]
ANQLALNNSEQPVPLIAIPTTAGTGSESTHFAVLYKKNKKFSIGAKKMLPSMVYLDANLCLSNSPYQNACSGFDALAQAIESYWSNNSNVISRYYSKKSIELILENFEKTVGHSQNSYSHVQKMLNASNYAGKAINITKTTGPHAISYGLTKNLGLPHGHAVAITLGAFFIMHNIIYDTHKQELKKFKSIQNFISKRVHEDLPKYLYALMDKFSMEYDITNLGLDEEKINLLITEINPERMANHPIKLDLIQLRKIFYLIPRKIDKFH